MRLPRRRIRTTRRLGLPGRPAPAGGPVPLHDSPTELTMPSVLEDLPSPSTPQARSQESTVEMPSVTAAIPAPPLPPSKMEFTCDCGATQVATNSSYDQEFRCSVCRCVMLLSLVYDGEQRSYEIVPFRVNPESGR